MKAAYSPLFEAIRSRCQRDQWYGPQLFGPLNLMDVPEDEPERSGFVFPPADEVLLLRTEARLGFALPSLLRALYASIANGGFGPGTGLRGVLEGYGRPGARIYPGSDDTLVAQYEWRSRHGTFELVEDNEKTQQRVYLEVPDDQWLKQLLPICDPGCLLEVCVDSREHLFLIATVERDGVYGLYQLPWTLEEWLWRWVRDEELIERYPGAA